MHLRKRWKIHAKLLLKGLNGYAILKAQGNINVDLKIFGVEAQGSVVDWTMIMNVQVPYKAENFFSMCAVVGFLTRTLLHGYHYEYKAHALALESTESILQFLYSWQKPVPKAILDTAMCLYITSCHVYFIHDFLCCEI